MWKMSGQEEQAWPTELETLTARLRKINLPHQIAALKTFEDKVAKAMENLTIRQKIATYMSNCTEVQHRKNGSTASRLRDQGNDKYKCKDNAGALRLYTESIICAPQVGPELSLGFGNRSAALFDMGDYETAEKDIDMALNNKYPKNLEYKLHLRKAQCLIRLGRYEEGLPVLQAGQDTIHLAKLSEEKKSSVRRDLLAMEQEARCLLQKRPTGRSPSASSAGSQPPPPQFRNSSLPQANPKLELVQSQDRIRGRYVVTQQDLHVGEILFSEEPFSSVLLPEHYSTHCHQCYARLAAPLPCKKCTQPRYCSVECCEVAWLAHHQYECGYLDLLHSLGVGHLAIRTLFSAGLHKLQSIRAAVKNGSYAYSTEDAYSRVFSLTHHIDKLEEEEVFQYTVTAALLGSYVARRTTFLSPSSAAATTRDQPIDEDLVNYLGGLVLLHLCQLIGNAHAVTELRESDNGDVQQVRLATGIYVSASMMNHSCRTLIINQFQGARLLVRATRPLQQGQEVTNCYGPHYRRHLFQERQDMLLNQYKFRCRCTACSDPKERQFLSRFQAMRCSSCDGPVLEGSCLDCGGTSDAEFLEAEEIQAVLNQVMDGGLSEATLRRLVQCEQKFSSLLYTHHAVLAKLRDFIARCYSDLGEYSTAASYSKKSLETTAVRYGDTSIEMAHEIMKYSDLLFAQVNNNAAGVDRKQLLKLLSQAGKIFGLNYGESCRYCQETSEKVALLTETSG